MQLFDKLILGEAVPTNPNQQQNPNQQDPNQQFQQEDPNQQMQQPDGMDPNTQMQQDPNVGTEIPQQDDGSMDQGQVDDGTGEEVPQDGEQPQEEIPQDGMEMEQPPADDLDPTQDPINFDIKPEQMNIKVSELKDQFKKLNSVITSSLEKIDKISHTTYDSSMIEFITRKLMELKEYSKDFLLKSFNTKTYIENQIELQRMIVTFNLLTNLISQIRVSREKRQEVITDKNTHLFKSKNKSNALIFSRGIDYEAI